MLKTTWRSIFIFICGMVATNELASASPLWARPKSPQFYAQAKPLINKPIVSKTSLGSQILSPQTKPTEANIQVKLHKSPNTSPSLPPISGASTWSSSYSSSGPANDTKLNAWDKPGYSCNLKPDGDFKPCGSW
jgi:hypothetical protein